jgi:hypothetical protein
MIELRPAAPAYWVSALAEQAAGHLDHGRHMEMQHEIRNAAHSRGLTEMAVARMVAEEWDRLGIRRVPMRFPGW